MSRAETADELRLKVCASGRAAEGGAADQRKDCSMSTTHTARAMRLAAHQLAAQIEHEFTGLTPAQRGDLRCLPCDLLAWADAIDPAGAPVLEPQPEAIVVRFPARIPVGVVGEEAWR